MATTAALILFAAITTYAIFGGADFGAGFWDLSAGGTKRGERPREVIDHAIAPVWEANHVWLIFVFVVLWTCFPEAYASITLTMFVPLTLAALGIVLRGASFAFRKYSATLGQARLFGVMFAGSSLITPFFLGTVAGAIASGRVPAEGGGDVWGSWLNPTSLFGGAIAVGTCCFLAGAFLTADAARADHPDLTEQLRRRTLVLGLVTGLVVFAALVPLDRDAPTLAAGLEGRAAPLIIASGLAGAGTLVLLFQRRYQPARLTAVAAVATVVLGWGIAQYPWMLVDEVTIADAAGAPATLSALLIVVALAGVIVLPALAYLLWLTQSERWIRE